jgi:hypothetical protein
MKTKLKNAVLASVSIFALAGLFLMLIITPSVRVHAGGDDDNDRVKEVNPPPFDFADLFYKENGIDLTVLNSPESARFGLFRQTGPPAPPGKFNWVIDDSNTSPIRNNVRILATTGAYRDSDGAPNQFFSIIAFAQCGGSKGATCTNQNFRNFFTGARNARGIPMEAIVGCPNNACPKGFPNTNGSAFEAYAGLKQVVNGMIAPSPCGTMGDGLTPCFPVTSVETSHLRQDWRLTTNRSRIDNSASFAYFGDNLLGMWVITYHWYTKFAVGGRPDQMIPTQNCQKVLAAAARQNGLSLDGTPIIHSGDELHFLEGVPGTPSEFGLNPNPFPQGDLPPANAPCAKEANEDPGGVDGGAVWLVCPAISDPTRGGIAEDAFVDVVRRADGRPLDPRITANFDCLKETGGYLRQAISVVYRLRERAKPCATRYGAS